MAERIAIELTFRGEPEEDARAALAEAGADGVVARPSLGITGVEELLVGFLLVERCAALITRLVRLWKCGVVVVVDKDNKKVLTEKNCDIPRGSVLLVHPDGTQVTLQEPGEPQISNWFAAAFKAVAGKG